jgi:hypothetical protein
MSAARKVDFLLAGVQKGGTSACFEYLREMPGLQLPDVKEVHFFDDETGVDWTQPDYRAYHRLFVDDGRMWGEATPIYLYWPNSLERIAAYNPTMRLILLFRDPVARAWSHWKMEYAKRKETQPFAWCIRQGRDRLASGDPAAPGHHRVYSYVERGFYGRQVAHLLTLFPRRQCLFLTSEALRDQPEPTLRQIATFLDQPPPHSVVSRIVHEARGLDYGSSLEPADKALLDELYASDLSQFCDLTGIDPTAWRRSRDRIDGE